MKRRLAIAALAAIAAFTLSACGKKAEEAAEGPRTIDTSTLPEQTTAPTPDPVLPAGPATAPASNGASAPVPPPPTLPTDPSDPPADTMGRPPRP